MTGTHSLHGAGWRLREACEEAEMDPTQELRALTFTAIVPAYFEASETYSVGLGSTSNLNELTT